MSDYEIKIYEKGIEEEQSKLGTEVTKDWADFTQTSAEDLKANYSREGFDPETRLYAFKDGKLVGFIVSRILPEEEDGVIKAQHDFPLVLSGHEEASKLLYKKAMKVLKDKGVKIIEARVGPNWLGTIELAKKLEYKKARHLFVRTELDLKKAKIEKQNIFVDFDPEKDREQLIQFYINQFNMTDEQAKTNYEGIISGQGGGSYFQPIQRDKDKIVARGLVFIPNEDPKTATIRPLFPDSKNFEAYLSKAAEFAKDKGVEKFQMFFGGQIIDQIDTYKEKGFEVKGEVFIFEKEI